MTEFIGSEAKQLYNQHRRTQEDLARANAEMERVGVTHYEIAAHGASEYRQADRGLSIASAVAKDNLDTALLHIEDNLPFYNAEAKQDMEAADKPYEYGPDGPPERPVHIP